MEDYWEWDEKSRQFWRKSTVICRRIQDNQHLANKFHRTGKIKRSACTSLRNWTKNEEKFESFKEIVRFFDQIDFLNNFY